jgi:hypothetical protein
MAVVNVKLVADDTELLQGESTVVRVFAQGTVAGVFSLGGYISAAAPVDVLTSVGGMTFTPAFQPTGLFTPKSVPGTVNFAKGGFGDLSPSTSGFGSEQTEWGTPDSTVGLADYIEVCYYTVTADTAVTAPQSVTLHFNTKTVSGYKPLEVDKTGVLGTITDATITVVPEPMTMALLALGGLFLARRRN